MDKKLWQQQRKYFRRKTKEVEEKKTIWGNVKSIFTVKNPSKKTLLKYKTLKEKAFITIILCGLLIEATIIYTILVESKILSSNKAQEEYVTSFDTKSNKNKVVVINLDEEITMESYSKIENIMEEIKHSKETKEVIFVFNTPGGSPVASDEIANYLERFPKPITAYIQSVAASGGYYIASSIPKIIANPSAIIGSIGVIMSKVNLEKLTTKIGIEEDNIEMGKYKAPISLFKPITEKNKKYIVSNLMSPTYETFLKYVAEHRNIPLKELRNKYAEGQVWAASHPAIQGKLIDKLSSLAVVKEEFNNKYKNKVDFIHYKVSSLYSKSSILGLNVDMKSETIEKLTNKINTIY